MASTNETKESTEEEVGAFAGQVFQAVLGSQQCQAAWLGSNLGWYQCLAEHGPMTPMAMSSKTETSERYAREWCEHQTVCGWISCVDPLADERQYFLSSTQKAVLSDIDSLTYLLPVCKFVTGLGRHVGKMKEAYQNDTGIGWGELGADARDNLAEYTRPTFLQLLGHVYIPQGFPAVHTKLLKDGGRIADIGVGCGWSSIGVAQAYPKARVDSFDLDGPSVQKANENIKAERLEDRVTAHCVDAGSALAGSSSDDSQPYDLVMALQCIHDMSYPVSVLQTMKALAGADGRVLIMEEKIQETFTGETTNDMEKLYYGFSLMCCLAECKSNPHSAETGTCMRPTKLEWYSIEAGFRKLERLPIENHQYIFYTLL